MRDSLAAATPPPPDENLETDQPVPQTRTSVATDPVRRAEAAFEATLPDAPMHLELVPKEDDQTQSVPTQDSPLLNKEKGPDLDDADIPDLSALPKVPPATVRGLALDYSEEEMRSRFIEAFGPGGKDLIRQMENMVEKVIESITERRAFFKDKNILDNLKRLCQREIEDERILEHRAFPDLLKWCVDKRPLVPVGKTGAYTTTEMMEDERVMLELASERDPIYIQPKSTVLAAIERKKGISDEQIAAVYAATLTPRRVTVIEGTAGAGKSFTMEAVKETYQEAGYTVMGTALGWAAAKVLGESAKLADENCLAIEGMVRSWKAARANGIDPFPGPTLLIVDEAGMVGTRHMRAILEETARSRYPVKVVLTGDSLQVVPVAAGNALEAIIAFCGTTRIDTIRRQRQASHRRAVHQLSRRQSGAALHTFLHQECIHWCKDKDMLFNQVIRDYLSWRLENPDKKSLVLSKSNADVLELNHRLRHAFKKLGMLGAEDAHLKVNNGIETFEADFSVGDEVLLRANDRNLMVYEIDKEAPLDDPSKWKPIRLGVFNRNAGRIVSMKRSRDPLGSWDFVIDLAGDNPGRIVVNSEKFKSHDKPGMPMVHNYATTIYGSQGQTVSQVFFIDGPTLDFRLAYVGMSRHREGVDIYLDETELHRRLDRIVGRRASLDKKLEMDRQGKKLEDAAVELGRYTRAEMLRAVAKVWGQHSENLTATIFERTRRLGTKRYNLDNEELTKIKPLSPTDITTDFLPSINKPRRLIDVDAILALPDPVQEQELVRPSDVEFNKDRYEVNQMPLDVENTPLPQPRNMAAPNREHPAMLPRKPVEETNFFGKALSWMTGNRANQASNGKKHGPAPVLRQQDPRSAFEDLDGLAPPPPQDSKTLAALKKAIAWALNPTPTVDIPFLPSTGSCGKVIYPSVPQQSSIDKWIQEQKEKAIQERRDPDQVLPPNEEQLAEILRKENELAEKITGENSTPDPRPHMLSFEGVPQVRGATGGPDDNWLASMRGILWDIGRYGEPRILAKDAYGQVVARYRMDGKCVVGDGFPPVIVNHNGNPKGPIYIVAGAKEWLWLREAMEKNHAEDPSRIPHIVWAAKDADLAALGPALRQAERVVVVRSKTDDRQIPWAVDLHNILTQRYRVKTAVISPSLSQKELEMARLGLEEKDAEPAPTKRRSQRP